MSVVVKSGDCGTFITLEAWPTSVDPDAGSFAPKADVDLANATDRFPPLHVTVLVRQGMELACHGRVGGPGSSRVG